jgi:hypothetical protein
MPSGGVICKNNRCNFLEVEDVTSIEDCERMTDSPTKAYCYYTLADKLNDISLCNKIPIEEMHQKERCMASFGIL